MAAVEDLHEADIDLFGELRVWFDLCAQFGNGGRFGVFDCQNGVRVTHIDAADRYASAVETDIILQRFPACVFKRQEGDFRRPETRFAHVYCYEAVFRQLGDDDAACGFNSDFLFPAQSFIGHETGETACAVAALFDFATVGVENPITEVGLLGRRPFYQQELVEAYAGMAVGPGGNRCRSGVERAADAVDNDKVVTQAVHFGEFQSGHEVVCRRFGKGASLA